MCLNEMEAVAKLPEINPECKPENTHTQKDKPEERCTTKHVVSKKHKIFFIKYTKFVKQNCITSCKLSNLTYYLTHIPLATQSRTGYNQFK